MKITKRQLRRIIKEEKRRILLEAIEAPSDPLFSAYFDEVMDLVDNHRFLANITDERIDRYDPDTAESIALAMEKVAKLVREEAEQSPYHGNLVPNGEEW